MIPVGEDIALVGVFGHPVGHSLSPIMHMAAIHKLGLGAIYQAFDVAPERLPEALTALRVLRFRGINLTIPHKEAALPLMDDLTDAAARVGAVNTVIRDGDRLIGDNTDGQGYLLSLQTELGLDPSGIRVAILGAGGAAKAIASALLMADCAGVTIYNRDVSRAKMLCAHLKQFYNSERLGFAAIADVRGSGVDLLINTTPVGMMGHLEGMLPLDEAQIHSHMIVSDIVYRPIETSLLQRAASRGARTHDGTGMLAYQGALAFERWFGVMPDASLMKETLRRVLQGESRQANN